MKRKDKYDDFNESKSPVRPLPDFKFIIPQRKIDAKLKAQEHCDHAHYYIICSTCSHILGSEVLHSMEELTHKEILLS